MRSLILLILIFWNFYVSGQNDFEKKTWLRISNYSQFNRQKYSGQWPSGVQINSYTQLFSPDIGIMRNSRAGYMHSISLGFVNFFSSKTYLSDSVGNNIALDQVTRGIMVRPLYQFLIPLVQDPKGKFQLYFGVGGSPGIGFSQNHRTPVNQFPFHQTVFVLQAIPEISGHFFWRPNENWWLSAEIPCNIFDASLQFWKTQNQLQVNDSGTQADYNFLPGPYGIRLSANRLIQTRLKPIKTKLR